MSGLSIAKSLEHSLLRPTITHDDVRASCTLALEHHLAAVCVYPVHVELAAGMLAGTATRVCAAIGFPFGQETLPGKLVAVEQAQSDGADEMAVMLDHSTIASGDIKESCHELERILSSMYWDSLITTKGRTQLTVVVETMLVDGSQLKPLWKMLGEGPAGFLQTSSGYQSRAVTEDHIQRLRTMLPEDVGIKAVGDVSTLDDARSLLTAGAVRVGTASAVAIAYEERRARDTRGVGGR
jgi:deoxyribose-phosphate aldolase